MVSIYVPQYANGPDTLYFPLGVKHNHLTATPWGSTLCMECLTQICDGFNPATGNWEMTLL